MEHLGNFFEIKFQFDNFNEISFNKTESRVQNEHKKEKKTINDEKSTKNNKKSTKPAQKSLSTKTVQKSLSTKRAQKALKDTKGLQMCRELF